VGTGGRQSGHLWANRGLGMAMVMGRPRDAPAAPWNSNALNAQ